MNRWVGVVSILRDAVENGSRAVEKIQKETANRPFAVLEAIGPIAGPAKTVHAVHDMAVTATHSAIRLVNKVVTGAVDVVLSKG